MSISDSGGTLTEDDLDDSNDSSECSYPSPSSKAYLRSMEGLVSRPRAVPRMIPPSLPPSYKFNLLQKLSFRQTRGKVQNPLGGAYGSEMKMFSRLPGRLAFFLRDAVPQSALIAGHIFLGFSKCGQFLLSYTQTTTENDSMDLNFSYYYRLHWWVFLPYAKSRKVAEVTLFSNQGVNGNLYIAFCQWPGDQTKLLVYGCQTQEGDMQDNHGVAPSASVHCYLTTTAVPSLNNCKACVKVANTYDADDVAAAWNSCVRLSCLIHGLTVHTQFDLVPPYPKFEPKISMKRNNTVVINTGNFLHAVTIDIEKQDESETDTNDQHQSSFARYKSSLCTKLTGTMSDLLNPIEVNVGVAEISMSGNGLIGSPAGLIGSPPSSFSPASFIPTSDSENTDAESEASIPIVRKVKKGQIKRKLPFGPMDPVKSFQDRLPNKSYLDRLESVKEFTDKLSPGGERRKSSPTKAVLSHLNDDDPFKLPVASASYMSMSGSDRRKRMAEAAYELTDDNFNVDAPETLSTFRRKRLADKKYEFTEDDSSENIVPLTRLRSKKIKEAAEAAAAESSEAIDDVISDVMVNSPSDVMVCVERRLKGQEDTQESDDCWADVLDGVSYPELLSPGGCIKKDTNSMSPRVSQALGPMSPRISQVLGPMSPRQAMSPRVSAWTPSEVHCRAKFTRRYIEVDDELISVITDVEDDDLGASTGYHTALPLEVHGSGYTQMYMVSKNKAEHLNLPCVRVQQRSLDLEQFCHETATGLCAAADKKFWFCNDYDVEVVDMDPHSGDVVAVAVVLIQAAIVTKSHGQKYNVSSLSRKQYQAGFKFCWNIDSGQYYVVDSDPLKEISAFRQEPSGVWNPARHAAIPLAKRYGTHAHNVRCLTNDSVITGISLKAIVDPDNLMAIILNDDGLT